MTRIQQHSWSLFAMLVLLTVTTRHQLQAEETTPDKPGLNEPEIGEVDREYWAYQPVVRPQVPLHENDDWSRNEIDRFIYDKLQAKGLQPAARADRLTLLRRVCFDVTGLPPDLQQLNQLDSTEGEADYRDLIHSVLESPAYGERWAQHWLDLVRFAETDGFEHDKLRPEAWRYRDWVIGALNQDLPYDEFLRKQIAGDELGTDSKEDLLATGYLLAGPDMPDINLQEERRHQFLNAMTANVGEVFLGLRFGCAQCHDHRTDPISQFDFYRLRSFFETIDLFKEPSIAIGAESQLVKARVTINQSKPPVPSRLWIRGDFRRPGPKVEPEFPRVLNAQGEALSSGNRQRRTALAEWLTDRQNPLTARVMVNRIWQHHFGVGLVPTPSDFGWMGEPAVHDELLDWMAVEFMESGWSMKHMHQLILNSATYQLASYPAASENQANWQKLVQADPQNRMLGRRTRRRLEGEAIRDAILAASGSLNLKRGGPGVKPPLPKAVAGTLLKNQWTVTPDQTEHDRRSVYLFLRRNLRLPMLEAFDKPDANLSCPERTQTTIAPQALHLLNSEFVRRQAEVFATRVTEATQSQSEQIDLAYRLSLGRPASESELHHATNYLSQSDSIKTGWQDLCHALLNLNEFIYVD